MTRTLKHLITALFICICAVPQGWGADAARRELPVASVGGRDCYVYDVRKGQNIYDVARDLGISASDLKRYNPTAADGLRPGMRLYIPVQVVDGDAAPSPQPTTNNPQLTTNNPQLTTNNPQLTTNNPQPTTPNSQPTTNNSQPTTQNSQPTTNNSPLPPTYTVGRGESLYGISRKFGLTIDRIIAMNPWAEYGVKSGDVLVLDPAAAPQSQAAEAPAETTAPAVPETPALYDDPNRYSLIPSEERLSSMVVPIDNPTDTVNMAVMLPFMLHDHDNAKNAKLFVEFYKGLLLAADSLKNNNNGTFINIYAYDTAASADTVAALMRRPEMSSMTVIIGPDSEEHLQIIADNLPAGTCLYNTFNVRSRLYEGHPRVLQANTPHSPMLAKAVDAFAEMYHSYTPVFLSRIDGDADKDAFVTLLKQRLETDSVAWQEVTFRNLLSHADLDTLPAGRNYVFVPVSGKRAEFAKLTEAVRRFGLSRADESVRIFGYPDWTVFRGEYFNRLCELEATIYTRFYADMKQPEVEAVADRFTALYGTPMLDAAPVQGLLGFDTGIYLIGLFRDWGRDFADHLTTYNGLQSAMDFKWDAGRGAYNDAIMIVTFAPDGSTIKTTLE